MKNDTKFRFLLVAVLAMVCNTTFASLSNDSLAIHFFQQARIELSQMQTTYFSKIGKLDRDLISLNKALEKSKINNEINLEETVTILLKKDLLRDKRQAVADDYQFELSKIRYRKGIELIKMIYEKTLGLDHHFTSLQTYQNVAMLSNPHSFPAFEKAQNTIKQQMGKKKAGQLPSLLQSNPFVSMAYTLVASAIGNGNQKKKEADLNEIACILDFTVRMNADLNIVFYETEFLKESNQTLKEECIELFKDYAKVIGYHVTLPECRKEDDWETMYEKLNEYLAQMKVNSENPEASQKVYQQQVNLEFSIDRLLQFMQSYSAFISQGEKYYQKFQTILNNYTNEEICAQQLPRQFSDLKKDVELSILKFNEAYNISELHGSKLKDLMYGTKD